VGSIRAAGLAAIVMEQISMVLLVLLPSAHSLFPVCYCYETCAVIMSLMPIKLNLEGTLDIVCCYLQLKFKSQLTSIESIPDL
jgi:hypothetical protein